ncbi:exosortase family protein XrtF [Corallibacter sp.]|uniref:exosortase family protein XrtF n=1 Tax=Corallibacter sp. TaxID=2038084 RepID=UPI003AB5DB2B
MKELIFKYKAVIKFIFTFLLVYSILTGGYKLYLQYSTGEKFYPDYMTHLVAKQSKELLNTFGYNAQVLPHPDEASMKLIINKKYVARVIEGCNSISVIILFISFIIAFSGRFKTTLFYILAGSVLIYAANLIRVVILSVGLYHYPWRKDILHSVIFPAIIYGMVCLLWVIWVNRFSNIKKAHDA